MIYTVEQGLKEQVTDAEWSRWSAEMKPVSLLLAVPGFIAAQRFKGVNATHPPSLAVYSIDSADVLNSGPYIQGAGGGNLGSPSWRPKLAFWHRNLFSGMVRAQAVPKDCVLLVVDSDQPNVALEGVTFDWLTCVGLDRTIAYRAFAVITASDAARFIENPVAGLTVYAPLQDMAVSG